MGHFLGWGGEGFRPDTPVLALLEPFTIRSLIFSFRSELRLGWLTFNHASDQHTCSTTKKLHHRQTSPSTTERGEGWLFRN